MLFDDGKYQWDTEKAAINEAKHGVSFEEARTSFDDSNAVEFFDEEHSITERATSASAYPPNVYCSLFLASAMSANASFTPAKRPKQWRSCMSNTMHNFEEPLDDSVESEVEEEFRFDTERARRNVLPRGVRKSPITLFLDDDIVAHFKQLAEQSPVTSLQAQINQALRAFVQQHQNQTTETAWLESPSFIKLLDERINAVVADRKLAA
jgi:uncharacterized DUF497 family protein